VNILLVKLSSLGDVVHTLPALSDARRLRPQLRFAWVVEENLTEVAAWHGAVAEVIPIALRRWRRDGFFHSRAELADFARNLRRRSFDLALDAQGLIKSGIVSALAQGERVGYDRRSARESAAALFYQKRIAVDRERHAIDRIRRLFAAAFDWPAPVDAPDFGITPPPAATETITDPRGTVVFLHATTWRDKHWPQARWRQLAALADEHNCRVVLPWGNALEQKNAHAIAAGQAASASVTGTRWSRPPPAAGRRACGAAMHRCGRVTAAQLKTASAGWKWSRCGATALPNCATSSPRCAGRLHIACGSAWAAPAWRRRCLPVKAMAGWACAWWTPPARRCSPHCARRWTCRARWWWRRASPARRWRPTACCGFSPRKNRPRCAPSPMPAARCTKPRLTQTSPGFF